MTGRADGILIPRLRKAATLAAIMKRLFYILMAFFSFTSCNESKKTNTSKELTGDISMDIKRLLPVGVMTADIMGLGLQTPRQIELMTKFQNGIKENYDWFVDYMKTVPDGEPMPFNSKFGLTESEYTELMDYLNNTELISSGTENIVIKIKNEIIYFKAGGKLSNFDSLTIDLKNNIASYKEYKLLFSDTSNITDDKNGLKSKWKGYVWKFTDPKELSLEALKDLESIKMKEYKLTIGKLEKSGKTYMSLKGREVEDGVKIVEFELPIILK